MCPSAPRSSRRLREGAHGRSGARRLIGYEVRLPRSALRECSRLDDTDQERLRRALKKLAADVAGSGRITGKGVKTIRGTDDVFHRLRVGDLRLMYDVIAADRVVLVLGIVGQSDLERWIRNR